MSELAVIMIFIGILFGIPIIGTILFCSSDIDTNRGRSTVTFKTWAWDGTYTGKYTRYQTDEEIKDNVYPEEGRFLIR